MSAQRCQFRANLPGQARLGSEENRSRPAQPLFALRERVVDLAGHATHANRLLPTLVKSPFIDLIFCNGQQQQQLLLHSRECLSKLSLIESIEYCAYSTATKARYAALVCKEKNGQT